MIKTKSKKILSLVLTLCMVLSLLPLNAFAAVTGGPSELDTLKVGNTTIESVTGNGSEIDAYKATAYVSDYNDVKLSITLTEKDSAKLYYKASETESISADEISTEITLNSGSASDQAITGLSSTNKYLLLKLDMEGSSSDYKYFVITVEKAAAPVISAEATITAGNEGATVALTADQNFNSSVTTGDFTVDVGETGLVFSSVSSDGDTNATLTFTGTAAEGTIKITAKTTAFNPNASADSNEATVTVGPKTEAGKTDKPQIKGAEEAATVMCEEGDTKAVLELENTYTGEVKVTVKDEQGTSDAKDVTGSYEDGKITLTFSPKLSTETTYQISVQEGDKTISDSVKVTVQPYKATTATPEAEGETFEITAQPGNKSAEIKLSNSESYSGEVTVNVYKNTDGKEKADDVETATYSGGTITLNFKTALSQEVTYKISLTEADKDESATVEVTITPYPTTATPTFESDTVTAEAGNKAAVFTVTNASSFSDEVTVKLYQESGEAVSDDSVTGAYAGGKLTLTFKDAINKAQKYTVEFQMANADPSEKSAQITVNPYKQTTATPQVNAEGEVTVNCDSSANNQALIVLVNARDYTAETVTVKVYNAAGSEAATDVTGTYKDGVITLKATEGTLSGNTYQVALMEDGKEESGKLTVKVEAYKASDDATITNVTGFISGDSKSYTGETPDEVEATGQSIADAIPVDIVVPADTTITKITFNVANKDVKVTYANTTTLTDDQGFTSADPQSGTNSEGTVTIDNLDFSSSKLLYVKVTAEDNSTNLYYAISVRTVNIAAGEAEIVKDIPTDDATALENLVDAEKTAIAASSATELNSAILDDIAAIPGMLDKINEPSDAATATANDGSAWGALKAANANIDTSGDLHFFYVPELEIVVAEGGFDADAKTLTVNITPYYKVIVTTQDNLSSATLDGSSPDAAVFIDRTELTTLKDVTVTIGVPTDIAAADAKVYVQHENDGWNEYTVSQQNTVDVKVPHFSEFQLRGDVPGQAMIGTKVYATVQEAVNAVKQNETITLTSSATGHISDLTPPTTGVTSFKFDGSEKANVTFTTTTADGYTYTASNNNGDVTVAWTKEYAVTVSTSGSGTMTADKTTAKMGDEITLTVGSGTLKNDPTVTKSKGGNVNVTKSSDGKYKFIMPDDDVTVSAEFESSSNPGGYTGGGGSGSSATVNSVKATNGSFAISDKNAKAGDTVKITPKANDGYVVDQVTVTDKNGNNITVTQNADGTYSFVMPAKSAQPVDVKVTFKLDDGEKDCPSEKFTDVDQDKWYHEGVDYAIKNGLMNGTGADTFAPDATTTRAMVVTILYRLDGEPAVTKDIPFADVPAGQWYSNAINWAAANGIVDGYGNGKFGPDDTITREQMAAILYRYASYKGYSVSDLANLTGYTDAASVSEWASTAMRWAVAEGLIEGTSATTLSPSGDSTRAQVATILMRFCEGVVK